jgi:hypothetical protein
VFQVCMLQAGRVHVRYAGRVRVRQEGRRVHTTRALVPGGLPTMLLRHARMHCSISGCCGYATCVILEESTDHSACRNIHGSAAGQAAGGVQYWACVCKVDACQAGLCRSVSCQVAHPYIRVYTRMHVCVCLSTAWHNPNVK